MAGRRAAAALGVVAAGGTACPAAAGVMAAGIVYDRVADPAREQVAVTSATSPGRRARGYLYVNVSEGWLIYFESLTGFPFTDTVTSLI
jgi:DsbC/DsbD-like thiol-disulfide interchange protein